MPSYKLLLDYLVYPIRQADSRIFRYIWRAGVSLYETVNYQRPQFDLSRPQLVADTELERGTR